MKHSILMHEPGDDVGVAVEDLKAGSEVGAATLEGLPVGTIKLIEEIPLGHKVAMRDIAKGKKVIEYGRPIGQATQAASCGAHVHTHNLKSMRWTV
jgi:(2R)-sulfolactate sulfo-lyase subunit alpha